MIQKQVKRKSIAESRNDDVKNLEHLTLTRNLSNENGLPHEVWDWLKEQYNDINEYDSVSKAMVSVLNSILNQERIFFAISRKGMLELVKSDMNFKTTKGTGFKTTLYSKILSKLQEDGYISKFQDSDNGLTATGYEVCDEYLLSYLDRKIDRIKQQKEVSDFVSRNSSNLREGTDMGTKDNKILSYKDNKILRPEDHKVVRSEDNKILRTEDVKIKRPEDVKIEPLTSSKPVPVKETELVDKPRHEVIKIIDDVYSINKPILGWLYDSTYSFRDSSEFYLSLREKDLLNGNLSALLNSDDLIDASEMYKIKYIIGKFEFAG